MNIVFPLKDPDEGVFLSSLQHYALNEKTSTEEGSKVVGGWFPVGKNRFWHGGVHLDGDYPIHAIADGTIVAYRLRDTYKAFDYTYKVTIKGNEQDRKLYNYPLSDNFVLIKHDQFEPVAGYKVPFYSLYMHLLPFDKSTIDEKKEYPPYFYSYKCVVDGADAGDGLALLAPEKQGKTAAGSPFYVIPKGGYVTDISDRYERDYGNIPAWVTWLHQNKREEFTLKPVQYGETVGFLNVLGNDLSPVSGKVYKVATGKDKIPSSEKGLPVVINPLSKPGVVGILKKGEEIDFCKKSEAINSGTGKIIPGWHDFWFNGQKCKANISAANAKTEKDTVDPILNSIQECEIPVKAGNIVGWTGEIGIEKDRKSVHLETFCKEIDFMKGRKDGKDKKTIVKVPQTATFKVKEPLRLNTRIKKLAKDQAELKLLTPEDQCNTFPTVTSREVSIVFKYEGWLKWTDLKYNSSNHTYTLLKDMDGLCSNHPAGEVATSDEKDLKVSIKAGEVVHRIKSDGYTDYTNEVHKKMGHRFVKYILPDAQQPYKNVRLFIKDRSDLGDYANGHYQLKKDLENCFYNTNPEVDIFKRDFVTDASEKRPLKNDFFIERNHCDTGKDEDGTIWWGIPLPIGSLAGQVWHNPDGNYDKVGWIKAYEEDSENLLSPFDWPGFHKKDEGTMTKAEKAEYNADTNDFICDISEIIKMVDTDDQDFQEKEIQKAITKTATADRLRGAVVHFPSEWFCPEGEDKIKAKFERLTKPPWGFKTDLCEAFGKVFKDLSFMQQLKDFKDNPALWFFHPIRFAEQLKRLHPDGAMIKKIIKDNLKTYSWGSTSIIGDAKLIMGSGIDANDIDKTKDKTFEVLYDLINRNSITEITISSLYRTSAENIALGGSSTGPHTDGRGVDVTVFTLSEDDIDIKGSFDNRNGRVLVEPRAVKILIDWLKDDDRVSQMLTSWRMISGGKELSNEWLKNQTLRDNFHYPHRHHLHITVKQ